MDNARNMHSLLTLSDYETRACASNQFVDVPDAMNQLRYGFFGEVGGLLSAVKKSRREELEVAERDIVKEELGDALWYFTTLVRQHGLTLNSIGLAALTDLQQRLGVTDISRVHNLLTFHEIDGLLAYCSTKLPTSKDKLLCELAARTGEVLAAAALPTNDLATRPSEPLLSQLLSDMIMVGAGFKLNIEEVALDNLKKIESRWPSDKQNYHPLFDENFEVLEQLPRELSIHFIQRELEGKLFVVQQWHGVNIGDRLTDNRSEADHYRFHDVFHLAYMAHLGWSPVTRGLLKVKRKSKPDIDENQDGARAMIIEEGIATWIFNHARERDYYKDVKPGKLEYGLLKQVHNMVSGYEVQSCALWQWEKAILDGFSIFRQLRDADGGIVNVDLVNHTIEFKPLLSHA